ncbi:unnamed protein product [Meganyctiphanes norvegica]|uniref:Nucleolar complex protein 2 homolog n=1 Tax=Meganyctiphanes norvegica TaxID=48144 RepID=A0AAV2QP75_MEGNR
MKIKAKKGGVPGSSKKNVGSNSEKKKRDDELAKMSVDDIFSNIAEESSDDESEIVPKGKTKKDKKQKKEKKKKEIPNVGSDSEFDDEDEMENASSMSQKEYLAKLRKSDPTFYATLMQSKDVMDLKSSDEEEEEEEEIEQEEGNKQQEEYNDNKLDSDSDESDVEEEGLRARGINMVTSSLVAKWEIGLNGDKPLDTFRDVEQGLLAAIESIQGNKDDGTSRYTVEGSQIFNAVVRLCLRHVAPALYRILKLKSAKDNPEKCKRWSKMKNYIKPYLRDMIKLAESVADPAVAEVVLSKGILPLLPFYIGHPPVCKVLLKCLITFWSQSNKKVRVLAFIAIFRTTRSLKNELLDWVLKRLYLSYVQNSRFTSPGTWGLIDFMRMSLVELYTLDQAVAYRHAFIYIRQMAFHLRNAIMSQKKERIQLVYNWQYIHCLHLWSELLCKTHPSEALQPLIYPLVQIAVGTITLQKSAAYFPLVFQVCSLLTDLSRHTETFIPVLPFLLEVLHKSPLDKKHKKMSLKPFDWLCMLKLSKSQQGESAFKDGIVDQVYDGIVNYLSVESASIGFPELVVPTNLQLKSFLKSCKVPNYTKKIRQLLEKVKENSDLIENKRKGVTFTIADTEAVKNWEISMRQSGTPLQTYYNSWKKVRATEALNRNKKKNDDEMEPEEFELPMKRKRELQDKHKAKDRTKSEFKGLFDDDEDDEDEDQDTDKLVNLRVSDPHT